MILAILFYNTIYSKSSRAAYISLFWGFTKYLIVALEVMIHRKDHGFISSLYILWSCKERLIKTLSTSHFLFFFTPPPPAHPYPNPIKYKKTRDCMIGFWNWKMFKHKTKDEWYYLKNNTVWTFLKVSRQPTYNWNSKGLEKKREWG